MSPEFSCLCGIPITELSLMRSRRSAAFLAFLMFACSLMLAACSKLEPANPSWRIGKAIFPTFKGRDIFSPVGAHLAAVWDYTLVGPKVQQLVRLTPKTATVTDKGIEGEVIALDDPFGSLITDISGEEFKNLGYKVGDGVTILLNKKPFTAPYTKTFMAVPVGDPLLYVDSRGRVGLALNERNFSAVNKITPPAPIFISEKGAPVGVK